MTQLMTMGFFASFGKPIDRVGWAALAIAIVLLLTAIFPRGPEVLAHRIPFIEFLVDDDPSQTKAAWTQRRRLIFFGGFAAALLSLGYVHLYGHDNVDLSEASAYFLHARALASGVLHWAAPGPLASFRGAFVVDHPDATLGVGVSPGFSLLLAIGFKLGAPLVIGPLVAMVCAAASYLLAEELVRRRDPSGSSSTTLANIAGPLALGLSIVSAALRHATAETMPQAASGAALALGLLALLRDASHWRAAAGLLGAFLWMTRPPVAMAFTFATVIALADRPNPLRAFLKQSLWMAPGIILLLWFTKIGIGKSQIWPELRTGGANSPSHVRVLFHLTDIANLAPLVALLFIAVCKDRRARMAGVAILIALGFTSLRRWSSERDAAEFFDLLPTEHALIAAGTVWLPQTNIGRKLAAHRAAIAVFALSLAGLAFHTSRVHAEDARKRSAHFIPDTQRDANQTYGLLFFDDAVGFNLAFDPSVVPSQGMVAVRRYGDDRDRLVYDSFGHPTTNRYVASADGPRLEPFTPTLPERRVGTKVWRFEAEADARVEKIEHVPEAANCSNSVVRIDVGETRSFEIPLPEIWQTTHSGKWNIQPVVQHTPGAAEIRLRVDGTEDGQAHWTWHDASTADRTCSALETRPIALIVGPRHTSPHPLFSPRISAEITAKEGPVFVDRFVVEH